MEKRTGGTDPRPGAGSQRLKIAVLAVSGMVWMAYATLFTPAIAVAPSLEKSVSELTHDLKSPLPMVRAQAVVALTQQQDKASVALLRSLLQSDAHATVRGVAAIALGEFKDTDSTSLIAGMLKRDKEVSPDIVLDALTRMADPSAAPAVLPLLDADNDVLRLQAVEALVTMQASSQGAEILRMAQANHDLDKAKNYAVVLGKLKVLAAQDYLLRLARETSASPTLAASYLALGRVASPKAIPLLSDAMGQDFAKGRDNAMQALLQIHSAEALPRMFAYLVHSERSVRFNAAEVIVQIPDPTSGPQLLSALLAADSKANITTNLNVIGPAAYALGRLKYRPAQSKLAALLANQTSPERETLAQSFGWMGAKDSTPLLIQTLREPQGEGRYGAAWSLGILEATEAVDDLQKAANSSDAKLANLSIEALGMIHTEKSLPFLVKKVQTNPEMATGLLVAIASVPGREATAALETYANHKDIRLSRPALQGLAQRKDASAVPALIKLIDTASPDNRKQVFFALTAITGLHLSAASEWRNWYDKTPTAR